MKRTLVLITSLVLALAPGMVSAQQQVASAPQQSAGAAAGQTAVLDKPFLGLPAGTVIGGAVLVAAVAAGVALSANNDDNATVVTTVTTTSP